MEAIVETVPDYVSEIEQCETLEEFTTIGISLSRTKTHAQWCLGLLAGKVATKYGEQSLATFAKGISVSVSSLQSYRWTVKAFLEENPGFIPPERLSFSVLQTVAKLPQEERDAFLLRAEDESMSVERVRKEIKQAQGEPVHSKYRTYYCEQCVGWHFEPSNPEEWKPLH